MNIAAIVLAAGASRRMGDDNKLLLPVAGTPMVARVVDAVLASRVHACHVVTGHQAGVVAKVLPARARVVHNTDWRDGMASSIRAGISALAPDVDAAAIVLGDMPRLRASHIDALIDAFDPDTAPICVPTFAGRRGNPVLWSAAYFPELRALTGDTGARQLLVAHAHRVRRVELGDDGPLHDVDTRAAYDELDS